MKTQRKEIFVSKLTKATLSLTGLALFFLVSGCKSKGTTKVKKDLAKINIDYIDQYNEVWNTQSQNSSESMPVGGGDIGCNVWVENGDILFYMSRSGSFDENNTMLKLGRTRIKLSPNPFAGKNATFKQELNLREGCIYLTAKNETVSATVKLWVEVFNPKIYVDIESSIPVTVESTYETWRNVDRAIGVRERMQCLSFMRVNSPLFTYKDTINHTDHEVTWYHRNNNDQLVFDKCITQQNLSEIRKELWNPQKNLTFGGSMRGSNMSFAGTVEGKYRYTKFKGWKFKSTAPNNQHQIDISLHIDQAETVAGWKKQL
ncbi:MAG: hypothetical protein KAG98_03755, partial [Lentisphaeria bacterium]|nr:hypothetical protein [Lentisphaeria bacterium]